MDTQALDKKLAEWAGFKYGKVELEKNLVWFIQGYVGSEPPCFTNSLDACFKWLVPKLYAYHLGTSFYPDPQNPAVQIPLAHCASVDNDEGIQSYRGYAESETPALALCLAIEELIDGESI